jgi:hypothetical protein
MAINSRAMIKLCDGTMLAAIIVSLLLNGLEFSSQARL